MISPSTTMEVHLSAVQLWWMADDNIPKRSWVSGVWYIALALRSYRFCQGRTGQTRQAWKLLVQTKPCDAVLTVQPVARHLARQIHKSRMRPNTKTKPSYQCNSLIVQNCNNDSIFYMCNPHHLCPVFNDFCCRPAVRMLVIIQSLIAEYICMITYNIHC